MEYIEFLGTCGTRTAECRPTCVRIAGHTVIDAGNLIDGLGKQVGQIEHIFLTHAHLDHICDIPFLIEERVAKATVPLHIYALEETIAVLKTSFFNNEIWPDFSEIKLMHGLENTIVFHVLETEQSYRVEGLTITPVKTNHTEGSCGYVVGQEAGSILVTADTYRCEKVWEKLNSDRSIHSLCIDVSFPSAYEQLARDSKHLTPRLLQEEMQQLERDDISLYPMHIKPLFYDRVVEEIEALHLLKGRSAILADGDRIYFDPRRGMGHREEGYADYESLIDELTTISVALSAEKDTDRLLELIVEEAKLLTRADGGTLYLLDSETQKLEFKVVQSDSLGIRMGGSSDQISWEGLPLFHADGTPNSHMVAAVSVLETRPINIADVYDTEQFDFSGTKAFDKETGYRSRSMLVIPLKNHEDAVIGVLQLINRKCSDGLVGRFSGFDEKITTALASEAAVALTKQQLIDDLERLFESFLQSINVAIEQKSKYTAGHIEKMVAITEMLIDAINRDEKYFADKHYTPQEIKEVRLAALMHDVGKIATPEYVVDKATKLETIYDRIASIRLKAEIRKRDLEIRYLYESRGMSEEKKKRVRKTFEEKRKAVEKEFSFLEEANGGSEFFSDEDIAKVQEIATAQIEIAGRRQNWLTEDEVMNLTIRKGTLTEEERQIVNNHAVIGLKMLERLPFPKKYARIPEIASEHHEQINGEGYPRGLKGDALSFEARILAVADIFEALTASDRPYKRAKKLSEAMQILYWMAKENRIDRDIVRFFYESGLYLKVAGKILKEEYIDVCDLDFSF